MNNVVLLLCSPLKPMNASEQVLSYMWKCKVHTGQSGEGDVHICRSVAASVHRHEFKQLQLRISQANEADSGNEPAFWPLHSVSLIPFFQLSTLLLPLPSSTRRPYLPFLTHRLSLFFPQSPRLCSVEVIGVAELVNKMNGPWFNRFDEDLATAFSIYCGISIAHVSLLFAHSSPYNGSSQRRRKTEAWIKDGSAHLAASRDNSSNKDWSCVCPKENQVKERIRGRDRAESTHNLRSGCM